MQTRTYGETTLPALGLGLMGMSDFYGPADRAESLATIGAAVDAGLVMMDTGDFYGSGHNELLLAEAMRTVPREKLYIQVKFGAMRDPAGGFVGFDSRPAAVKNFLAMTLKRLGTDYIDLYQPARLDPSVPIEDTVGTVKEMIDAGYVRHLGLSEVGSETIRRAHKVHPVTALQIEYSLLSRSVERILPTTRELGVALNPYGVLGRGLISGHWSAGPQHRRPSQRKPALLGREPAREPCPGGAAARDRRGEGGQHRRPRHRLGSGAGGRHRPAGRRAHPASGSPSR